MRARALGHKFARRMRPMTLVIAVVIAVVPSALCESACASAVTRNVVTASDSSNRIVASPCALAITSGFQ